MRTRRPQAVVKELEPVVEDVASHSEREFVIAKLRISNEQKIEWLQAISDGVLDAVIQTQDVSVEAKEISKQLTFANFVFQIALNLALKGVGDVVEKALKQLAQSTVRGILSTNTAFRLLPKSDEAPLTFDEIAKALDRIKSEVKSDSKTWNIYSDIVQSSISQSTEKITGVLTDFTKKVLDPRERISWPFKEKDRLAETDLPRTAVTKMAQSFVASHRLAMRVEGYKLEAFIRTSEVITKKQLESLASSLSLDASPDELGRLRSKFALLFEAMIWSMLYQFNKRYSITRVIRVAGPGRRVGYIDDVPDPLTEYWWDRFAGVNGVPVPKIPEERGTKQSTAICHFLENIATEVDLALKELQEVTAARDGGGPARGQPLVPSPTA